MMNDKWLTERSPNAQFNKKDDMERLVSRLYAPNWKGEIC